jgi:hypothetical protein
MEGAWREDEGKMEGSGEKMIEDEGKMEGR